MISKNPFYLPHGSFEFPPIEQADENGFIAFGQELSAELILAAYHQGIFPWYMHDEFVFWYSPDPRMLLKPEAIKISKSMKKVFKKNEFEITANEDFIGVIEGCSNAKRKEGNGTWLNPKFKKAYCNLHLQGHAHSIEAWQHQELVGGLYGVHIGKIFVGESMFSNVSNASKACFIQLSCFLQKQQFKFIDCQVYNPHLASLGAEPQPRQIYLNELKKSISDLKHAIDWHNFFKTDVVEFL